MLRERYLLWGAAVALLVSASLFIRGRPLLEDRTVKTVEATLERARIWGHEVELSTSFGTGHAPQDPARGDPTTTRLLISEETIAIRPSERDAPLFSNETQLRIRNQWVRPYLRVGDYNGALRSLARAYVETLERARQASTLPRPPPILGPDLRASVASPYNTSHWGAPLAVVVLLLGLWLSVKATRAGARNLEDKG